MLGYQKYQEFRSDITAWLASRNVSGETGRASYFEQLEQVLKETGALFTPSYMDELTDFFLAHRRIFASGIGKSMNPALLMNHLYKKHDLFVTPCPLDGLRDTADHLGEEDLLVLFSVSASAELMDRVRSTESDVLLCTANAAHPYKNLVTKTVVFPYLTPDPELSSISPVLFDVFVELLDRGLTERTASDSQKKDNRK